MKYAYEFFPAFLLFEITFSFAQKGKLTGKAKLKDELRAGREIEVWRMPPLIYLEVLPAFLGRAAEA